MVRVFSYQPSVFSLNVTIERALEIPTTAEVSSDGGSVSVRPAAHDAYKVKQETVYRQTLILSND